MKRIAATLLALPLLACSEAQICRYDATRPLDLLDAQIRATEDNVARGYELIEVPAPWVPEVCEYRPPRPPHPRPPVTKPLPPGHPEIPRAEAPEAPDDPPPDEGRPGRTVCRPAYQPPPDYERRYINVEAERAKLHSLYAQRKRLLPQVQAALAQCPAD